jgi:hypothetical protein
MRYWAGAAGGLSARVGIGSKLPVAPPKRNHSVKSVWEDWGQLGIALLCDEEPRIGSARPDAECHRSHAPRAPSLIGRTLAVAVYPGIYVTAVEPDAHPGAPTQAMVLLVLATRVLHTLDFEMIRRWLVHLNFYRLCVESISRWLRTYASIDLR